MVVANTIHGLTRSFDLSISTDLSSLRSLLASGEVTAISLRRNGVQHSLVSPRGWGNRRPVFGVEPLHNLEQELVGERVFVQAGDVRVSLTWTFNGSVVRTDLTKIGTMRYNALGGSK